MPQLRQPALILALGLACNSEPATETPFPPCVDSETLTIGSLSVIYEDPLTGEVRGVDLDDRQSTDSDRLSCYEDDFDDPDGSRVDNQFASLGPTLETGFDVDPRTIFEHDPLTLAVDGVGDGVCAAVTAALEGGPERTAEWNGSTLRVYHLGDVPLRLTLPESSELLTLHDAAARLTLTAGGQIATVVLSGGLDAEAFADTVAEYVGGGDFIRDAFVGLADLEPDEWGECTRISIAFEAHPPDPPRP